MQQNSLHAIDYIIILVTLAISLSFGAYFARKQGSSARFFKGSGNIPSWVIGMSILATLISSVTFLAYPGSGYSGTWILLVQGLMVPVVLLFLARFIVPLYRDVIGLSAYEYFEKRFGFYARLYSSIGFMLMHFSKMGTVFFLLSLALSNMMGMNAYLILWIVGITVIIITMYGGIEAVIWLDLFQGLMLIGGGLVSILIIVTSVPGGLSAIWTTASASNKTGFGPYDLNFTKLTFFVMVLNGIFYAIQKYGTDQTMVQRYLTAKSDKSAIKAAMIGVLLCVPVWALFMFIGTSLFSFYKISGSPLPAGIKADAIFPFFIMTQFPVGVVGLVIAALLSSAVASLNADINCLSAIGVADYYTRFKKDATDIQKLRMGKLFVVLSGLGALGVATIYLVSGGEGALKIVFTLYAIFSGGVAGLFLLGIFSKRANKQGLYIGIVACVLFTGYALLTSTKMDLGAGERLLLDLGRFNFVHHNLMLGVYSHVVLFVVGWVASLFFPKREIDGNLTIYSYIDKRRKGEIK